MNAVVDVTVIGGGPAGIAVALSARENGAQNVVIIERDTELGGILNQCIHSGFGLQRFKEELTGPEYAERYIHMLSEHPEIEVRLDTTAIDIISGKPHIVRTVSSEKGVEDIATKAVILAMGCRERPRGAIAIPGTRPAGVLTAGAAQRYENIEGLPVGREVVILGSGDIGLIMARRMTLSGAKVKACIELMPYSSGLARNIAQCLEDFDIPLYLSHTITEIHGKNRLTAVTVSKVDENRKPIEGSAFTIECDTLLLSVGLIPENELTTRAGVEIDPKTRGAYVDDNRETSVSGIYACGNVAHVHDIVDYVSMEAAIAGKHAALKHCTAENKIKVSAGDGILYTVPQYISIEDGKKTAEIFMRVKKPMENSTIKAYCGGVPIASVPREHMTPGEMERIVIAYSRISGDVEIKAEAGK